MYPIEGGLDFFLSFLFTFPLDSKFSPTDSVMLLYCFSQMWIIRFKCAKYMSWATVGILQGFCGCIIYCAIIQFKNVPRKKNLQHCFQGFLCVVWKLMMFLEIHSKTSCKECGSPSPAIETEFLLQPFKDACYNGNMYNCINAG